jgi:hypothetical protein
MPMNHLLNSIWRPHISLSISHRQIGWSETNQMRWNTVLVYYMQGSRYYHLHLEPWDFFSFWLLLVWQSVNVTGVGFHILKVAFDCKNVSCHLPVTPSWSPDMCQMDGTAILSTGRCQTVGKMEGNKYDEQVRRFIIICHSQQAGRDPKGGTIGDGKKLLIYDTNAVFILHVLHVICHTVISFCMQRNDTWMTPKRPFFLQRPIAIIIILSLQNIQILKQQVFPTCDRVRIIMFTRRAEEHVLDRMQESCTKTVLAHESHRSPEHRKSLELFPWKTCVTSIMLRNQLWYFPQDSDRTTNSIHRRYATTEMLSEYSNDSVSMDRRRAPRLAAICSIMLLLWHPQLACTRESTAVAAYAI